MDNSINLKGFPKYDQSNKFNFTSNNNTLCTNSNTNFNYSDNTYNNISQNSYNVEKNLPNFKIENFTNIYLDKITTSSEINWLNNPNKDIIYRYLDNFIKNYILNYFTGSSQLIFLQNSNITNDYNFNNQNIHQIDFLKLINNKFKNY